MSSVRVEKNRGKGDTGQKGWEKRGAHQKEEKKTRIKTGGKIKNPPTNILVNSPLPKLPSPNFLKIPAP